MNKTVKYVLIAGAVGAVVYIAAKRLAPAPAPDKPATVGGALDNIVGGVTKIVNTVRMAPAPSSTKQEYLSFGNYTLPTDGAVTRLQRATIGAIDGSQYAYGGLDA
jgi:hypothetical protein